MKCNRLLSLLALAGTSLLGARAETIDGSSGDDPSSDNGGAGADTGHFIYPVQGQSYQFYIGDTVNFTWSIKSNYATFTLSSDDRNSSFSYGAVTGMEKNNGSLAKLIEDDTPPGKYYALVVNKGKDFNVSYFDILNTTQGQRPTTWNAWDGKTRPTATGVTTTSSATDGGSSSRTGSATLGAVTSDSGDKNMVHIGLGGKIAIILGVVVVFLFFSLLAACCILRRRSNKAKAIAASPSNDASNLPEVKRNSMLGFNNTKPQGAGYYEMDSKTHEFKGYEMPVGEQYAHNNAPISRPTTAGSTLAPTWGGPTPPPPGTGYARPGYPAPGAAGAYPTTQSPISPNTPVNGTALPQNHGFVFTSSPAEVSGQPMAAEMPATAPSTTYHAQGGYTQSPYQRQQNGSHPGYIAEMAG